MRKQESWPSPLLAVTLGELVGGVPERSPWRGWCRRGWCRRARRLTNSAATQTQIQGSELAHPNVYSTCELLEHVKGLVLLIQSCRISMTLCNSRRSQKSASEDPVLMIQQKPEAVD